MSTIGRKGAASTAAKLRGAGLAPSDLPHLDSHDAAKQWLETIGRAVATGQIPDRSAQAAIRAVEAWLKAEGDRLTVQVVEELKKEVDRLRSELGNQAPLRAVP